MRASVAEHDRREHVGRDAAGPFVSERVIAGGEEISPVALPPRCRTNCGFAAREPGHYNDTGVRPMLVRWICGHGTPAGIENRLVTNSGTTMGGRHQPADRDGPSTRP